MPQIIQAYGREYEFPDGMSDDAIRAALLKDAPTTVAGKAAARLPQMRKDEAAAQEAVKNDTVGRGVGQALGGAVFSLPADVMAKNLDHPILSAVTMGQYPVLASMLPGMVRSAGNQLGKAGSDVRTAATGNQGPNQPPATLPQRGRALARAPLRVLSAALAPAGVAGAADQADALATADDPNAAAGRTFTNAAMTGGAIPLSKLTGKAMNKSGANLRNAADAQMANIFERNPQNTALIDQTAPQLADKGVRFTSAADLPRRAGSAVTSPGPGGKPTINASGMGLVRDATSLAQDVPPSQTPGQILGAGAKAGGKALAEGAAG